MNQFLPIIERARDDVRLGITDAATRFLASPEFQEQTEFRGENSQAHLVALALAMLRHVALDPRDYAAQLLEAHLETGYINLAFFGVSTPFPAFEVGPGSADHLRLQEAIRANLNSRAFTAAKHAVQWRSKARVHARHRQETAVTSAVRRRLAWASPEDYKKDPEQSRQHDLGLISVLNEAQRRTRDLRNSRLSQVNNASAPGLKDGWYGFLRTLALESLQPAAAQA